MLVIESVMVGIRQLFSLHPFSVHLFIKGHLPEGHSTMHLRGCAHFVNVVLVHFIAAHFLDVSGAFLPLSVDPVAQLVEFIHSHLIHQAFLLHIAFVAPARILHVSVSFLRKVR